MHGVGVFHSKSTKYYLLPLNRMLSEWAVSNTGKGGMQLIIAIERIQIERPKYTMRTSQRLALIRT